MDLNPRVLQVVLSLNPGGTERLLVELAARLNARMPMMVCCLDEAGSWASELEARGVPVRTLGRGPGFSPSLGGAIAAAARRHGAAVIHAHQYSPFVYSAIAKTRHPRSALIFTEHGRLSDAPPSPRRRAANRLLKMIPNRVFAVSEDLRRHMVAEGFAAGRIQVIYNGIDPGPCPDGAARGLARERLGWTGGEFVIGSIGRLDPVKDFGTLIRAIAACPADVPVRLAIIGSGPDQAVIESQLRQLNLAGRVRLLGHRDDARQWLAGCDAYVNSSVSEGVSLTILEAMAAGLPVIATEVGGTPEVVADGCGVLVPARDPEAMARAIQALAEDAPRRQTLGAAARARVEARFTLDRMVREYAAVYQALAARRVAG